MGAVPLRVGDVGVEAADARWRCRFVVDFVNQPVQAQGGPDPGHGRATRELVLERQVGHQLQSPVTIEYSQAFFFAKKTPPNEYVSVNHHMVLRKWFRSLTVWQFKPRMTEGHERMAGDSTQLGVEH